jgi:hypothetical protein
MNEHRLLHELLPYRMQSADTLNLALIMRSRWPETSPMSIRINDNLTIVEGNLNAFTNPVIEAGLVHCRALLEFLGLCMTDGAKLGNIGKRRRTDIGVECFRTSTGYLTKVTPDHALTRYAGGREEAEKALVAIFQISSKGLAHITEDLIENPEHGRLVEIASRGVPSLVISHLYTPLGLQAPAYKIKSRLRENSQASVPPT